MVAANLNKLSKFIGSSPLAGSQEQTAQLPLSHVLRPQGLLFTQRILSCVGLNTGVTFLPTTFSL